MKYNTARFGEIEVPKEEVVFFPEGLFGFSSYHNYVIFNTQDGSPFRWLQSLDDGDLAFVIIEPLNFMFSYDLEVSDDETSFLGLVNPEDAVLYVIVTIPENTADMTANLQGPLVINIQNRKGKQIISTNQKHSVKVKVVDELAKREAKIKEAEKANKSEAPRVVEGQG
ncbi:MAG: flagellar assembly protein FliW [Candidatus Riflebacteria bacterium]|nr:flagellar assembly protein FliW [Candidatus Riflebacteria bacterium]